MSEKQETIADIEDALRHEEDYWLEFGQECPDYRFEKYADRLEAALERKMDKSRQQYDECARDYNDAQRARSAANSEIAELKKQIGNGAKLREALSDACYAMFNFLKTQSSGYEEMANALDKAKAALAAPARNCDVGDAADWESRFGKECDKGHICSDCPVGRAKKRMAIELDKGAGCEFVWAQMPYESKEGSKE